MSSAKRRINSTGRKRITRESIDIQMLDSELGQPLKAKANLTLNNLNFPGNALVAIEAYRGSSGMRFDCGTVDNLSIPPILVLDEVDKGGSVLFRVRVVDNERNPGQILGSAERIQPSSENEQDGRKSLFPVRFCELGSEVWKVNIEHGGRPELILNREIPGIRLLLQENHLLQGILFPAALRIVLEALVKEPDEDDDDETGWKTEWIAYCQETLSNPQDPKKLKGDAAIEWIDDVVRQFCSDHNLMNNIKKMDVA